MQRLLHKIKAQQFYTDLDFLSTLPNPTVNSRNQGLFKAFESFSSIFQGRFNLNDYSSKSSKFKYFSNLCETWYSMSNGF